MGFTSLIGGIITGGKKKKAAKRAARAERARVAAEKERQRIEQVRANLEVRRERQKQLREARIKKAQIISSGVLAGVGFGTSTIQGAAGSIASQFGANIGNLSQRQSFSTAITEQNFASADASGEIARQQGKITAADAQNQIFQSIGGLEQSLFQKFAP